MPPGGSALLDVAAAIREVLYGYAARLSDLSDSDLHDFVLITSAFAEDFKRDAEYAYMIEHGGDDYPERAYGVRYER